MEKLLILLVLWFIGSSVIFFYYRKAIIACWREPVLKRAILIIESDDWGPGPTGQAPVLLALIRLLASFSDSDGRRPVMTLGVVLAAADGDKIRKSDDYHRRSIVESIYVPLLDAIKSGVDAGVFTVQLHGMEHFWPQALMAASRVDDSVKTWIDRAPQAATEELPSPLQSRWVDASVLPARRLSAREIGQAVQEEVNAFQAVFGSPPKVAVPPTFVWNDAVEQAWAESGVEVIVTPGCRYETRDVKGLPEGAGDRIYNSQSANNGIVYLVRNDYFEPALGHSAEQAVSALELKTRLGRPTLLETHRFNFLAPDDRKMQALVELKNMLRRALEIHPALAFISTEQLARVLTNLDPDWVEQRLGRRLHVWLARLAELSRLRKLAWISGWIIPGWLVWKLTG